MIRLLVIVGTKYFSGMADSKKLKLITNEVATEPNQIFIGGTVDHPNLSYIDNYEKYRTIVNLSKTMTRPLFCKEVYSRLSNRYWNKVDCTRFIEEIKDKSGKVINSRLFFRTTVLKTNHQSGLIDILQESTTEVGRKEPSILINGGASTIADEEFINSEFYRYFGTANPISYRKQNFGIIREDNTNRVDLIRQDSTTYTSHIDLNSYLKGRANTVTASLTVQYSLGTDNIFSKDILVVLKTNNQLENSLQDINDSVQVECINGVIRLFPLSSSVVEYIISRCTLIYGNQ